MGLRLALVMAAVMLILIAGLVSVAVVEARRSARMVADARLRGVAGQLADVLATQVQGLLASTGAMADLPEIRGYADAPSPATREAAFARLSVASEPAAVVAVALLDAAGNPLIVVGDSSAVASRVPLPDSAGIGTLRTRRGNTEYPASAPVRSGERVAGYVVQWRSAGSNTNNSRLINDLIGSGAVFLVGNRDGSAWTDLSGPRVGPPEDLLALATAVDYQSADGDRRFGLANPIEGTPWQVALELSYADAMAPARRFILRMSGLGVAFLLIGLFGVYAASQHVTRPIRVLTEAVEDVAAGDYSRRVTMGRRDEIGVLAQSFDTMAQRVLEGRRTLEQQVQTRTSELSAALQRLQHSERLLFQFLNAMPLGVQVVDAEGMLYYQNDECRRILRGEREGASGLEPHLYRMSEEGEQEPYADPDRPTTRALNGEAIHVLDAVIHRDDEVTPIEIWSVPVYDAGGGIAFAVTVYSDITERTVAEREIHAARDAAEAANRAKSEFLAKMSHELRTPLNSIIGFSEILLNRTFGDLNEKQERHVRNVHASGHHLLGLINEVLDLSKVEAGHMELALAPASVPQIIREVFAMLEPQAAAKRIALTMAAPADLPHVRADLVRVRQVLQNLVGNAIKFTPEEGSVTVSAKLATGSVEIEVADTGIGIAPADQDRVWEEFEQVRGPDSPPQMGTGLGLTLVRRFVELHGGTVRLNSDLGRGSEFTFTLPLAGAPGPDRAEPESEPLRPVATGPLVLVVEDEGGAAELLEHHLSEADYRVARATSAKDALRKARVLQPAVITLDIMLPDGHGSEVLAELRAGADTAEIPVVVVSISSKREIGEAFGVEHWLVKPVSGEDVVSAVGAAVRSRRSA